MPTQGLDERFAAFIRSKRLRKTEERFAILRKVVDLKSHFDADSLHQAMESEGYHVSRSTVYNTLELLCQCGILRRHVFDTHQAQYELAERNHMHLVCTVCGAVRDVEDDVVESRMAAIRFPSFSTSHFALTVYGTCSKCQRRMRRQAKTSSRAKTDPGLKSERNTGLQNVNPKNSKS